MQHLMHIPHGFDDPTLWVWVALLAFIGLVVYKGLPGMLTKALDARAAGIAAEIEEAKRLREEAQELLAGFQRRQREAEKEAEAIVAQAKREANRIVDDARAKLADQLERRAAMAERKIAQAEAEAEAMVRNRAAELAATAAEKLLRDDLDASAHAKLIDASVAELERKFS